MNSWMSTFESACAPPFRMFMSGTGSVRAPAPPTYRYSGSPCACAAALAAASETPRIEFAPSFDFVGVPSSSIIRWSSTA